MINLSDLRNNDTWHEITLEMEIDVFRDYIKVPNHWRFCH